MFKAAILFCIFFLFPSPSFSRETGINLNWFGNFNDDLLIEYIYKALNNNKDIEIARLNILKYRQEKNLNISEEFPLVSVGANYLLLKVPKLAIPNNDIQTNSFALPFMTVWEIDYLGKKYNKIQKSRLDVENSLFDLKSAQLAVAAETAGAYFNISGLNKQIDEQEKITKIREEFLARRQKMFDSGVINALEFNREKQIYLEEKNKLEELMQTRNGFLTGLAYLTGESPYEISEIKVTPFDKIVFTGVYPEFLKGDIIENRPDIMKLENELKKAKLDVSIAKKDFLPSINVFGLMVFSTFVQNFGWSGVFAALSAGATQTLFDGGRRIFNLKKRKIEYDIAIENYLKADLNALREVNDALYNLKKGYDIYNNDEKRAKTEEDNFIRVLKSYNSGARSYPDYLDESLNTLSLNINLYNSKNNNFINLLTLYKATGGAL